MGLDQIAEAFSRRLAARTTRRSFLVRAGQTAVLVASGPALASLLVDRAEARVCGQSGVAPKCPTFDCNYENSVWGWCWYASRGCCNNGGIKKICDCCTLHYPFVHGYCPSGHNVRCIVESCHADPRVMYVPLVRVPGANAPSVSFAGSRLWGPDTGGTLLLGDIEDPLMAAVAAAAAGALGAAFLLATRSGLDEAIVAEIQRRKLTSAVLLDSFPITYDEQLAAMGLTVERVGKGIGPTETSLDVARWLQIRTGSTEAVCIEVTGVSAASAPSAAALAGSQKLPLLLGVQGAIDFAAPGGTWLVGPEAVARTSEVANARALDGPTKEALALSLASMSILFYNGTDLTLHLAPSGQPDIALGLAGTGGMLQYHPPGEVSEELYGFIYNHRTKINRVVLGGSIGTMGNAGIYDLQSVLHQFDTHRLQGRPGQGLPVVSQPHAERAPGAARIDGPLPPKENAYWASRANTRRTK